MLKVVIPQFDFGYNEQFTVYTDGRHLNVKDLTGFEAWLFAWSDEKSEEPYIGRQIDVADDPTSGIVYWNLIEEDTYQYGNYKAEIRFYHAGEYSNVLYTTMQFNLQITPAWQGLYGEG